MTFDSRNLITTKLFLHFSHALQIPGVRTVIRTVPVTITTLYTVTLSLDSVSVNQDTMATSVKIHVLQVILELIVMVSVLVMCSIKGHFKDLMSLITTLGILFP